MQPVRLDDFMAFNEELAALVRAGIPLSMELASSPEKAEITLQQINAEVARQVSHGLSIEQAIAQNQAFPTAYRGLVLLALESGDFQTALTAAHQAADATVEARRVLRLSLIYPAIVICLAYLGLVGMCLFFVPVLANLYQSMQLPASAGLKTLLFLRATLPYWVAVPPLLLILLAVFVVAPGTAAYQARGVLRWLPGMRKALFLDGCATFADSLATLLEHDVQQSDAMNVAAQVSREPTLLAYAAGQGGNGNGQQLPPFLRWALLHEGERDDQSRALRTAARIYREAAQSRVERLRIVVPLLTCVLIGGSVTLLYGLALFLPMVELLEGLA